MRRFFIIPVALAAMPFVASASDSALAKSTDADFAQKAWELNSMLAMCGEMGEKQSSNPNVTQFAKNLSTEHSKLNTDLRNIAKSQGIKIEQKKMGEMSDAEIESMSKMKGEQFDKPFLNRIVRDHETAIKLFQDESTSGQNAKLKEFATKTLPGLQAHLKSARNLEAQIASGGKKGASERGTEVKHESGQRAY